jgi:6-phosphogluconolactonase (cycloisomerase 2 family)
VVAFRRDPATGLLSFVEAQVNGTGGVSGLAGTQGITMSPDGVFVYTASIQDNEIAVFRRDHATGKLAFVQAQRDFGSLFLMQPESVAVSPDGDQLYAAIFQGDVVVYERDPQAGTITYTLTAGSGPGGPLVGAEDLLLSPDGTYVYVAASIANTVSVFRRRLGDGALTLLQTFQNHAAGVTGLGGAAGLALSPDGRQLYVAGRDDRAVTVFDRDPATGRLTFGASYTNGSAGVSGLWGAVSLVVSPGGGFLYVSSIFDGNLVVFRRDHATGRLSFVESHPGIGEQLVQSPEGAYLYEVGPFPGSVSVYRSPVETTLCLPGPTALCLGGGRFKVEATWTTGQGGSGAGQASPMTADTGYFWFFDPANVETVVKVLDGCPLNGRFWVFAGGLTDVAVQLTVTDTQTGQAKIYRNPQGKAFQPIQDTGAFAACP